MGEFSGDVAQCVCVCGFGVIVGSTEPFQGAIFPAHYMYTVYSLLCPHLSKPQPPTHLHCCIAPAQLCHSCAIPSTYQFTTLTHTHTHMPFCSHIHIHPYTHIHPIHTYTQYTHTHIHPIHPYTHTHIHPYTHTPNTPIHTYTHTPIHTHIHTYTLTQTEFEVICVLCTNVGVNQEDKKPVSYTACLCTYIHVLACFFLPSFSHLSLKHIYHVQASINVKAPSPVAVPQSLSL